MDKGGIIAGAAMIAVLYGCTAMDGDMNSGKTPPPPSDRGSCGAAMFQSMVGQPEGEIHEPSLPTPYRIIGPDDMITQDHRPDRLNIYLDGDDRVKSVRCG